MVEAPPIAVSNELKPTDGVAQFFFVPLIDEELGTLDVHLVFDRQWVDLVGEQLYLFMPAPFEEREIVNEVEHTQLVVAPGEHFHHVAVFESQESLERCLIDFSLLVTNFDAQYEDAVERVQRMALEPGEMGIRITVPDR